jgi:hypothetical protein
VQCGTVCTFILHNTVSLSRIHRCTLEEVSKLDIMRKHSSLEDKNNERKFTRQNWGVREGCRAHRPNIVSFDTCGWVHDLNLFVRCVTLHVGFSTNPTQTSNGRYSKHHSSKIYQNRVLHCTRFNNCTLCPHCIYVFCIFLRTNSYLCTTYTKN